MTVYEGSEDLRTTIELWNLASFLQPKTVYIPQLSGLNPGIAYLTKY